MDRSIVIFAFVGFVIAAEINPDEPSAVASCDDLANFASHRDFLLGSQRRHTPRALHGQQSRFLSIDCKEDDCSAVRGSGTRLSSSTQAQWRDPVSPSPPTPTAGTARVNGGGVA